MFYFECKSACTTGFTSWSDIHALCSSLLSSNAFENKNLNKKIFYNEKKKNIKTGIRGKKV